VWTHQGASWWAATRSETPHQFMSVPPFPPTATPRSSGRSDDASAVRGSVGLSREPRGLAQFGQNYGRRTSVGDARQGMSVALSGDGDTGYISLYEDAFSGAAWVFCAQQNWPLAWTHWQHLVGTGALGKSYTRLFCLGFPPTATGHHLRLRQTRIYGGAWYSFGPPRMPDRPTPPRLQLRRCRHAWRLNSSGNIRELADERQHSHHSERPFGATSLRWANRRPARLRRCDVYSDLPGIVIPAANVRAGIN